MNKRIVKLVVGAVYQNKNGRAYLCKQVIEGGDAIMERVSDKWTIRAIGVCEYANGVLEWNYSKDGFFADRGCG